MLRCLLAVLFLLPPGTAFGGPFRKKPLSFDKEQVLKHFRESRGVPPSVELDVTRVAPSKLPSLTEVTITARQDADTQDFPLYLSEDGRHYFSGGPSDLAVMPDEENLKRLSLENVRARGPQDAPVTIVEFSDIQCPYCKGAHLQMKEIVKDYDRKVRWVYKHFPLKSIHPWAEPAAAAADCAGEQKPEAFWEVTDMLFDKQREITPDNLKKTVLARVRELGLDAEAFSRCYDSGAAIPKVNRDVEEAGVLETSSTPTFFVNGHRVSGLGNAAMFRGLIDEILEGRHPAGSGRKPGGGAP